ncbi:MAG TPA: hypothetical protein VD840_14750 [Sinorhizobium sp.]|nr:hypothetical protein [Sinorhizobium sp.]
MRLHPIAADIQIALAALLAGSGWLLSINALRELPSLGCGTIFIAVVKEIVPKSKDRG